MCVSCHVLKDFRTEIVHYLFKNYIRAKSCYIISEIVQIFRYEKQFLEQSTVSLKMVEHEVARGVFLIDPGIYLDFQHVYMVTNG